MSQPGAVTHLIEQAVRATDPGHRSHGPHHDGQPVVRAGTRVRNALTGQERNTFPDACHTFTRYSVLSVREGRCECGTACEGAEPRDLGQPHGNAPGWCGPYR